MQWFLLLLYQTVRAGSDELQNCHLGSVAAANAGADDAAITVYETVDELSDAVAASEKPVVVLPNYTSMLTVRDRLSALAGGGRFWE